MFELGRNKSYQSKKKSLKPNNLIVQKLKWKPKIPLYKEIESKYNDQLNEDERIKRMKLLEIKS